MEPEPHETAKPPKPYDPLNHVPEERRCTAVAAETGKRCKKWAIAGTDRCGKHRRIGEGINGLPIRGLGQGDANGLRALGGGEILLEEDFSALGTRILRQLATDKKMPAQTRAYAAARLADRGSEEVRIPTSVQEVQAMSDAELHALASHLGISVARPWENGCCPTCRQELD